MATPKQPGRVSVQVVYVANGHDFVKDMLVPVGQTVGWCVNASGVAGQFPEVKESRFGVWGKVVKPEREVAEGDRIEVYVRCTPEAAKKARVIKAAGIADAPDLRDKRT